MKCILFLAIPLALISCGPSDEKIQQEVNSKLPNAGISANVSKGVVTLTGQCPDDPCKSGSEAAIKDVKGVKSIVNNIAVAPPPPPVADTTALIQPDAALNNVVPDIAQKYGVTASVNDGVVTLTGTISRSKLQQLMQELSGARPKKIENNLKIK